MRGLRFSQIMDAYKILFDEKGLIGIDVPQSDDAQTLAERFAFIRALRPAIETFEREIQAVETKDSI